MEEVLPKGSNIKRPSSSLLPGAKNNLLKSNAATDFNKGEKGYPITFQHLGKRGYVAPLFATSIIQRKKWIEHIEAQQSLLRERASIFTRTVLTENYFGQNNRVNCLVPVGRNFCSLVVEDDADLSRWWPQVGLWYGHGHLCVRSEA